MSIKIYYGYKMPIMNLIELLEWCENIRIEAEKVRLYLIKELYGDDEDYYKKWSDLQRMAWEVEKKGERNPSVDFSFGLSLFPVEDYILIIVFCEHDKLRDLIHDNSKVDFFGYWTNTDHDETEEEWDERKRLWNKVILDKSGIPNNDGFSFFILNYNLPIPKKFLNDD